MEKHTFESYQAHFATNATSHYFIAGRFCSSFPTRLSHRTAGLIVSRFSRVPPASAQSSSTEPRTRSDRNTRDHQHQLNRPVQDDAGAGVDIHRLESCRCVIVRRRALRFPSPLTEFCLSPAKHISDSMSALLEPFKIRSNTVSRQYSEIPHIPPPPKKKIFYQPCVADSPRQLQRVSFPRTVRRQRSSNYMLHLHLQVRGGRNT